MLEGFFDDSGTHLGSDIVVWGGVMGDSTQFRALEERWVDLLKAPIPGKPCIRQFHLSHINNAWGEFALYNEAERNLVTKAFRDIVIDARLVPVSFSVSTAAWARHVTPVFQTLFRSPEHFAFMSCVMAAFRMGRISRTPVAMTFDAARLSSDRQAIVQACRDSSPDTVVEIAFCDVGTQPALQAADMVAYEAYLLSQRVRNEPDEPHYSALARAHFRRLLEGAPDAHGFMIRDKEMKAFVHATDGFLRHGVGDVPTRRPGFQNVFEELFDGPAPQQ